MSKLIVSRRRFLMVAAPAIVTAANLMPGHSMEKLLAELVQPKVIMVKYRIVYADESSRGEVRYSQEFG